MKTHTHDETCRERCQAALLHKIENGLADQLGKVMDCTSEKKRKRCKNEMLTALTQTTGGLEEGKTLSVGYWKFNTKEQAEQWIDELKEEWKQVSGKVWSWHWRRFFNDNECVLFADMHHY